MTAEREIQHPDTECRRQYLRIHRRTWRAGLDDSKVRDSKLKYSVAREAETEVSLEAYRPTGVALGHPLPCLQTTRRLFRFAKLVERKLSQIAVRPCFAFVPPAAYHITLYNRSHFDHGPVFDISPDEQREAARVIDAANVGRITVELNGLLISSDGRLLVRGYPHDERIHHLRRRLGEALPSDAGPPSILAHIKLGHVLVCPALQEVREVLDWLDRCGHHVSKRLSFEDVFTPLGRVKLNA
jgi:hypothetical protein